jgi:hypothetical protein
MAVFQFRVMSSTSQTTSGVISNKKFWLILVVIFALNLVAAPIVTFWALSVLPTQLDESFSDGSGPTAVSGLNSSRPEIQSETPQTASSAESSRVPFTLVRRIKLFLARMALAAIRHPCGTTAQHARFTGFDGEITVNTETKNVHVHDGTTPGGFPTDYTVNIKRCGAKGDGVADDTTAFRAAFRQVSARGGVVYCPEGTYRFTSALTPPANVRIVGAGMAQAHVAYAPRRPTRLLKSGDFTGVTLLESSSLENLSLDGVEGNGGGGVVLFGATAFLHNVGVYRQGGDGVTVGGTSGDQNFFSLSNVTSGWNGGHGFYVYSAVNNANAGKVSGCRAWFNAADGFRIGNTGFNTFDGCYSESNQRNGWKVLTGAKMNSFAGCGAEANGAGNAIFDAGSENNAWTGATNVFAPTDDGKNSVFVAQGGEVGRRGWVAPGMIRAGVSPSPNGAFTSINGFGAHGGAGQVAGYYMYDSAGVPHRRGWEMLFRSPVFFFNFMDDDGSNPYSVFSITRLGEGPTAGAEFVFNNKNHIYLPGLPVYSDNLEAIKGGLTVGRIYKTPAGQIMVRD